MEKEHEPRNVHSLITTNLPVESACSKRNASTDMSEKIGHRDALYLFACHLEWRTKRNLAAYQELLAALDDHDGDIRRLAECLLHRSSPRPERTATGIGILVK